MHDINNNILTKIPCRASVPHEGGIGVIGVIRFLRSVETFHPRLFFFFVCWRTIVLDHIHGVTALFESIADESPGTRLSRAVESVEIENDTVRGKALCFVLFQ